MNVLELVPSDELICELANRHREIIVIREDIKGRQGDRVFVKTGYGSKGRQDKGYDLMIALEMLEATLWQLTFEYLEPTL